MTAQRATQEQQDQLRKLFTEIGPAGSMHAFAEWLNTTIQTGNYGPNYKDVVSGVVPSLRDAEKNLSDIRG